MEQDPNKNLIDFPQWDHSKISHVSVHEILRELKKKEHQLPAALFTEIIVTCRDRVVEWMKEVMDAAQHSFATIFLAVGVFDRVLIIDEQDIARSQLQLLGAVAILIAAKFEEDVTKTPSVAMLNECTNFTYNDDLMRNLEIFILNLLQWDLRGIITPYDFFAIFREALILPQERSEFLHLQHLSHLELQREYGSVTAETLLQVILQHYQFLSYLPSVVAAAIIYLTRQWIGVQPYWPPHLQKLSLLDLEDIIPCAQELEEISSSNTEVQSQ